MTIATQAAVRLGLQRPAFIVKLSPGVSSVVTRPQSLWAVAGAPPAGVFDNTLPGVTLISTSAQVLGQLRFNDPPSGRSYLAAARLSGAGTSQEGSILIADRLWHNGNINQTITTPQTVGSPQWPDRDINGGHTGDGVLIGLEVEVATGAVDPGAVLTYTNQAGVTGRTGTPIIPPGAAAQAVGNMLIFSLQGNDSGVRTVESLTYTASWLVGTVHLVAFRPLLQVPISGNNRSNFADEMSGGFPRLFDGSVPYVISISGSGGGVGCVGNVTFSAG